jgi:asparagine synthase (glutamine-hydrolysing)
VCGIAGILRWDGQGGVPGEIERMTQAIAHRGPDGDGVFAREGVALGHRRLSIIDLATGRQPMANEDGEIQVTFNGEIYNYRALADELRGLGHVFKTRCDTEVIVHAYEEWGDECVRRLRGMFAFGIADFRRRRMLLARDPIGIKPLHYRTGPGFLAFASELAALRAVDAPTPRGRLDAVDLFLRFQYIPSPWTIYEDVWKLPAGHYLTVDFNGRTTGPTRYWDLEFRTQRGLSEAQWLERFEAVLAETVQSQLMADVPFGVFLSGGIDSTLVALHMSRLLETPIKGFTIGYEETDFSELPYARQVARHCGFEIVEDVLHDDFWEHLPQLVQHYGEPFGDSSAVPTWAVSRLARASVPMVLSGDGGDEAFGGYDTYGYWLRPDLRRHLRRVRYHRSRDAAAGLVWALVRRVLNRTGGPSAYWQREVEWARRSLRRELWRSEHLGLLDVTSPAFEEAHARGPRHDALGYAQYVDFKTYLPECILTKVDIASMYHGLEVRPPLLDLKVLELAAALPADMRLRGSGATLMRKFLPKRALEAVFPAEFVHRRKQGFSIPAVHWFGLGTNGAHLLQTMLLGRDAQVTRWLRPETIGRLIRTHAPGENHAPVLWLLLVLELWLRQNGDVEFEGAGRREMRAEPAPAAVG